MTAQQFMNVLSNIPPETQIYLKVESTWGGLAGGLEDAITIEEEEKVVVKLILD